MALFCFRVQISTKCEHCACKNWSSSHCPLKSPCLSQTFSKCPCFGHRARARLLCPSGSELDKGAFLLTTDAFSPCKHKELYPKTKNFTQRLNHPWPAEFSGPCFFIRGKHIHWFVSSSPQLPSFFNSPNLSLSQTATTPAALIRTILKPCLF